MPVKHHPYITGPLVTATRPRLMAGYGVGAAWRRAFGGADFRAAIQRANEEPIPRPLALLVQVPTMRHPRAAGGSPTDVGDWLPCLEREVALKARLVAPDRHLARILMLDPEGRCSSPLWQELLGHILARLRSRASPALVSLRHLDVIGLGPGAISRVERCLVRNSGDPCIYCDALDRGELPVSDGCRLGADALALGDLLATLIDEDSVDLDVLSAEQGLDFDACFSAELAALPTSHVERRGARLMLTAAGMAAPDTALQALLATASAHPVARVGVWQPRLITAS